MDRLKGKVAAITGGALGLGRATALRMAEEGCAVAVCDILIREANALVDELAARGFDACFWQLDVSREADVERVLGEVARRFGQINILVNNAGVAGANKPTPKPSMRRAARSSRSNACPAWVHRRLAGRVACRACANGALADFR